VFENIIAQAAAAQIKSDILLQKLAPSMLFFGPAASGKGSTAIELARTLSCEEASLWSCACSSCVRHRSLSHPDLAMIGPRNYAAEISASRAAFLRDSTSEAGKIFFIRSLRKLLARFAPSVWENEQKQGKANPLPLLHLLEEELAEFETINAGSSALLEKHSIEKLTNSIIKNAVKLDDECLSEIIPIAQVRKAAYWSRLSPAGKRKTLIIENAGRMEEKARNALLKLLEEPPGPVSIVLTVSRRESLMPTILSRLRPYRFITRNADKEKEIIKRVFREPEENIQPIQLETYLESFLPQPSDKLLPLAAFFITALARSAAVIINSRGTAGIPNTLAALGSYCAKMAESSGFERTINAKETIAVLLSRSSGFEGKSFPRFLSLILTLVSQSLQQCIPGPGLITCREMWKKHIGEAQAASHVWKQKPEAALESLFYRLREETCKGANAA
jgi:DNA polymerase-3 subunit gamma/tau